MKAGKIELGELTFNWIEGAKGEIMGNCVDKEGNILESGFYRCTLPETAASIAFYNQTV